MSQNQQYRLKTLMQKYPNRSCSVEERNELVEMVGKTSGAGEVDELWREVWASSDGSVRLEDLSWEILQEVKKADKESELRVVWKQALKWSAVAAAVLVCIYFATDWMMKGDNMLVYETGYGERLEIVLDDGTKVNLNADSKFSWDKDWEDDGVRRIKLEGEAYFDVSHIELGDKSGQLQDGNGLGNSSQMPFEVLTPDLTIRVLGTAFNASQRRGKTEVFLERGSVELSLHQEDRKNEKETSRMKGEDMTQLRSDKDQHDGLYTLEVLRMKPGDYVSYSSGEDELVQKIIDAPETPSEWKEGVLSYQDEEFQAMLRNLEDIYGKKFEVVDQDLLHRRVNFSVPYKDWDTVAEMMKLMLGVEITRLEDNRVQIK